MPGIRAGNVFCQPMSTWKIKPVKHPDGSDWSGVAYIDDGNRQYGSLNEQQAIAICRAHNAATAAKLREANDNLFKVARKHSVENTKLREQLKQREDIIKRIEWSTGDKFPRAALACTENRERV